MSCVCHHSKNSGSRVRGTRTGRSSSSHKSDPCKKNHSRCNPDPCHKHCGNESWNDPWNHCDNDDWDPCNCWWNDPWKDRCKDHCRDRQCHGFEHYRNIPRCEPRFGQLVRNGGFENPADPFRFWVINGGVESIIPPDMPHEGDNAARLNFYGPAGFIYQDIPGVCPCNYYLLSFFLNRFGLLGVAQDNAQDPAQERFWNNLIVRVRLEFLDAYKNVLGSPALDLEIAADSLHTPYQAFINVTSFASPRRTHFARISFAIQRDRSNGAGTADSNGIFNSSHVNLDDVSLVAVDGHDD